MKNEFPKKALEQAINNFKDFYGDDVLPEQFNIQYHHDFGWGCEFEKEEGGFSDCTFWMSGEEAQRIFKTCDVSLIDLSNWEDEFDHYNTSTYFYLDSFEFKHDGNIYEINLYKGVGGGFFLKSDSYDGLREFAKSFGASLATDDNNGDLLAILTLDQAKSFVKIYLHETDYEKIFG